MGFEKRVLNQIDRIHLPLQTSADLEASQQSQLIAVTIQQIS